MARADVIRFLYMDGDTATLSSSKTPKHGPMHMCWKKLVALLLVLVAVAGIIAYLDPSARAQVRSWYASLFSISAPQQVEGNLYLTLQSGSKISARLLDVQTGELVHRDLDGDRALEWMSVSPSGEQRAYFLQAKGTTPAEIRVFTPATGERMTVLSPAPESARHIRWSPDGETLVFTAREEVSESASDIEPNDWAVYIVAAAGGEATRVATGVSPSFSPDGSIILSLQNNGLYATSLADGASKIVRSMQGGVANRFMSVTPSPDGTKLLWTNPLSENREGKLFVFDVTSWTPVTVSETARVVRVPALHAVFSPDSQFVAFMTNPPAERGEGAGVHLLELETMTTRLLLDLAGFELGQTALTDWR